MADQTSDPEDLHAVVVGAAAAFGGDPGDDLVRIHDVAGFAVDAVGEVDLQLLRGLRFSGAFRGEKSPPSRKQPRDRSIGRGCRTLLCSDCYKCLNPRSPGGLAGHLRAVCRSDRRL